MEELQRELDDEASAIKDVSLVGSDGGRVMATKAILAIHSPVFHRMFYGNFKEAENGCDSVELNFGTPALRQVVSYCYTQKIKLSVGKSSSDVATWLPNSTAVELMAVRDAANYFELTRMRDHVGRILAVGPGRRSALVVLKELILRGETDGELWSNCMKQMKLGDDMHFNPVPFVVLEILFRTLKNEIPPFLAYNLLADGYNDCDAEEERSELQKFANDVDLEEIQIRELVFMEPTALFSQDRLYKALENAASKPSCSLRGVDYDELKQVIQSWEKERKPALLTVRLLKYYHDTIDIHHHDHEVAEAEVEILNDLQEFADGIDLESIEISELALIQPCPLFAGERLFTALANAVRQPSTGKRPRSPSE